LRKDEEQLQVEKHGKQASLNHNLGKEGCNEQKRRNGTQLRTNWRAVKGKEAILPYAKERKYTVFMFHYEFQSMADIMSKTTVIFTCRCGREIAFDSLYLLHISSYKYY